VVDRSNLRWCCDGFEIGCDDGEKLRVAFALDCCGRKAMGFIATTESFKGEDVQDLMIAAVDARFGQVSRLPHVIGWLSDSRSGYIAADTKALAREIGVEPRTTPVQSPQSNGMAETFVRTMKRDYVRVSPHPHCSHLHRPNPMLVRALQHRSPTSGARRQITARVHRGPNGILILSGHLGRTTIGMASSSLPMWGSTAARRRPSSWGSRLSLPRDSVLNIVRRSRIRTCQVTNACKGCWLH
jgi:transposase InsO family protein